MAYTIGSLFDGSGGFPLAATLCGMEPKWAAEVEPYPIAVTRSRFPTMKHLGSVTDVHGGKIDSVDVITFGSPCQDLSVAGKRKGLKHTENGDDETTRSGLFMEAVRIIKEMRDATNGKQPRFALWENVPGAFSSNKGEDFRIVLEELIKVAEPQAPELPPPGKDGWPYADCIVGDGWSLAWRVFDAQYWGVPQRRRRIHLVADFTGQYAGEVLFEREGVRGYFAQGGTQGQRATAHASGSVGGNCYAFHMQQDPIGGSVSPCIGGQHQATVGVFMGGQGEKSGGIGYSEMVAPTIRASESGSNRVPDIVYPEIARTLTGEHDSSPCIDRGRNVICIEDDGNTRARIERELSPCMKASHTNSVVYPKLTGQDAFNDMLHVNTKARHYIVRRLTPTECARLQGFPDWWGHPDHKDTFTEEELAFWNGVRDTYAEINGKQVKVYTAQQVLKWYNGLHTDSSEYKMWGNGIALPPALYVMQGIYTALEMGDLL